MKANGWRERGISKMRLNQLCYVDKGEGEGEGEGEEAEAGEQQHQQPSSPSGGNKRHPQFLSLVRRSLSRLLGSKWPAFCRCDCQGPLIRSPSFHDIPGIEFFNNPNPNVWGTGRGSRKHKHNQQQPRIFSYAELYIGTHAFSVDQVLGSGGFGRVYKAVLPSDGTLVAVKCFINTHTHSANNFHFQKTFAAELVAVAYLRHRNLVRLRGWCVHEHQLLLVYDYMPNRSLDRLLFKRRPEFSSPPPPLLTFERRHQILLGLATALFYLHQQLETQIIHRDVKSSNIMLDSHYNARLGDFGLARWLEHDLQSPLNCNTQQQQQDPSLRNYDQTFRLAETTKIGGTIGYLPPESFHKRYVATARSDVFGFGVVVLEVASGRRAVDLTYPDDETILLDWIRRLADEGRLLLAGDARLSDGSYKLSHMERLIHLGLLCTLHDPKSRPNMKWALDVLCGNILGRLPALPSFKTHPLYLSLSAPAPGPGNSTTITLTRSPTGGDTKSTSTIYITAAGQTIFVTAQGGKGSQVGSGSTEAQNKHHRPIHNPNPNPNPNLFPVVETPREISFQEIVAATNNFSDSHRGKEVDFGTTYQGFLATGHHVLVKRLGMRMCLALRARFSAELHNLGRLRHRNLVQLRGWCTEQGEMLVVYDFLGGFLLSPILFRDSSSSSKRHLLLQWHQRYNIIRSLASAILYLHEEWDEQVIHRNITSSSIVLDRDLNPRLSCFALAEFLTRNEHGHHVVTSSSNNSVQGIFGYMSPEYMDSGEANTAADIYSFGMVVLEVISGQKAVDFRHPEVLLVKKVRRFATTNRPLEQLADPQLDGDFDHEEFLRLIKVGLACTLSKPHLRPSMRQIASILDGNSSCFVEGYKEGIEEWRQSNACSLSLTRRIQALGIQ